MKRSLKLWILLGCLVVLTGVTLLVRALTPSGDTSSEEDTGTVIFQAEDSDIISLGWTINGQSLNFTYDGTEWVCDDEPGFTVDEGSINTIIYAVDEITASRTIETSEDLSVYGLADPACVVTIGTFDGTQTTLSMSEQTTMSDDRYCSLGDGNIYLIDESIYDCFDVDLNSMSAKEDIPSMDDVTSLTITNDSGTLDIVRMDNSHLAYSDSYIWFLENEETASAADEDPAVDADSEADADSDVPADTDPEAEEAADEQSGTIASGYTTLDTELTEDLIDKITGLSWYTCVAWNADDEALASFGLDDPDAVVTVAHNGSVFTFELAQGEAQTTCYARIQGSSMVYTIASTIGNACSLTTANDLLPDEVIVMDYDPVTSIDITIGEETYTLIKESREVYAEVDTDASDSETDSDSDTSVSEDGESVTVETYWTLDGNEIDIQSELDELNALSSSGSAGNIVPDKSALVSFVFHRSTESWPEVTLTFYTYNSSSVLTVLNGTSTVYTDRTGVVDLVEELNALLLE